MNLLRYFEAKQQNRNTIDLIRVLDDQGRLELLPSAMGEHYKKFNPASDKYDPSYCCHYERDRYIMNILTCANDIQAVVAKNGDMKVVGAQHCGNKALCACCGTREARRVASQLRYMFFVNRDKNYDYYMLTLTLPNRFDGFREEFKIYDKCLNSVLGYVGYSAKSLTVNKYDYLKGFFASRELTYTKEKGFHPHIHIILAYDKSDIGEVKYTRKGVIKSFELKSKRGKLFSALSIRDYFQLCINKYFPEYYQSTIQPLLDDPDNDFQGLNIDFRHIDDIDNSCDEICKYFIDYNSFSDPDSLFIYLRDIYNLRKYSKRGCFGWSEEREDMWRKWCSLGKPTEQNFHFIYFAGHYDTKDYIYFGTRKVVHGKDLIDFPCYYHRSELTCNGDPFVLHYNSSTQTYSNLIFDNSVGRLVTVSFNKRKAEIIKEKPFNIKLQHQFDYYLLKCGNDGFGVRQHDIDIFKEGRISDVVNC